MPAAREVGMTSASIFRHSIEYCGWLEMIWSKPVAAAISTAAAICVASHSETPT